MAEKQDVTMEQAVAPEQEADVEQSVALEQEVSAEGAVAAVPVLGEDITVAVESMSVDENFKGKGINSIMKLRRFCFLGSFEPVYAHLSGYIKVTQFWSPLKLLFKDINDTDIIPLLLDILGNNSLVRRDEVLFVLAAYLASPVDIKYKTAVRLAFPSLIATDDDVLLFFKYDSLIREYKNIKSVSRTVRKAITAWYEQQPVDAIRSMWLTHRGAHGVTHNRLMKLCSISDISIGSAEVGSPFFKTCKELLKEENIEILPEPEESASANEDQGEGQQEDQNVSATPFVEPPSDIVGIAMLRTIDTRKRAIRIIRKYNLPHKCVPGRLLRFPVVMGAVLPTMTYLQIFKYWRKMVLGSHFKKGPVFEICKNILENVEFANANRIHPVHILMSTQNISKNIPSKNYEKRVKDYNLDYLQKLYLESFDWPAESANLRMHITVNLQKNYKKKFLKNHKNLNYFDACLALSFGYCKREPIVDVFHWCEEPSELKKIPLDKNYNAEMGFDLYKSVENEKNKQRLATPLLTAISSEQIYDVFLCIVPKAGRGNPNQSSEYLCSLLDTYREQKNSNARFIILNLLKCKQRSMKYSNKRCENILEICGLDKHTTDLIHNFATGRFV